MNEPIKEGDRVILHWADTKDSQLEGIVVRSPREGDELWYIEAMANGAIFAVNTRSSTFDSMVKEKEKD